MSLRKVALVHEWLTVPAGSEEVFEQMCDLYEGPIYGSVIDPERCKFVKGRELHPSFVQRLPKAKEKYYWYSPLMPWAYQQFDMRAYDMVLTSSHSFAHGVRTRSDALHIVYYHTPARSLWVPEIDDRASKTPLHRAIASVLRRKDLEASKGPTHLLANSETTAARLRKFYGREVTKVIPPPVHTARWLDVPRDSEDEGFLYWGRLIAYKKVDILIEAVRITGHKLNIVGSGPMEEALKKQAEGMTNVVFHGRLPDDQLKQLMARSRAVLFAAYEDFGIVPVEAMAAGLPVVAYGVGGAGETIIEGYGSQFLEQTPQALAEAIGKLETQEFDPAKLRERAKQYDVATFRDIYHQTVESIWNSH